MDRKLAALPPLLALMMLAACANIGTPDGGPYDEDPPRVVNTSPKQGATHVKHSKVILEFDENIKLENAYEKVVISPPQVNMAEISASGKRITVELQDTLLPDRTYTIDFADAIQDNNEGNPMGDYAFTFATGEQLDTFQVSGYVLNAEDLEPIKGMLVGLYTLGDSSVTDDLPDSVFRTTPFERISRTDSRGHFVVKGLNPDLYYRAFALSDADGDYMFSQKSERIAFSHERIRSSARPDIRYDTVWHDSIHYDSIVPVPYTHFYPDDILLLAFTEGGQDRAFLKSERKELNKFTLFFTAPDSMEPVVEGIDFDATGAFVVEKTSGNDTLTYWLRDSLLYYRDTLTIAFTYRATDTLGMLQQRTDTLELVSRLSYEKYLKQRTEAWEDYAKNYRKDYKERQKQQEREALRTAHDDRQGEPPPDGGVEGPAGPPSGPPAGGAPGERPGAGPPPGEGPAESGGADTPLPADTLAADTLATDTLAADTLLADTLLADTLLPDTLLMQVPPLLGPDAEDTEDDDAETVEETDEDNTDDEEDDDGKKKKRKKKKRKKKDDDEDIPVPPMPEEFLALHFSRSQMDPDENVEIRFDTPIDTAYIRALRFTQIIDSDTIARPFVLRRVPHTSFRYILYAEWVPEGKYELQADTGAFLDIYAMRSPAFKKSITVKSLSTYSTLFVRLQDVPDGAIISLLDQSGKALKRRTVRSGKADFYFVNPATYYLSLFIDANGDGLWTTGDYDLQRHGEDTYFYPGALNLRADWEVTQTWHPTARPRYEQKPGKITKQKPDKEKTSRDLNKQRDEEKRNKK